jgi:hypothetical protein
MLGVQGEHAAGPDDEMVDIGPALAEAGGVQSAPRRAKTTQTRTKIIVGMGHGASFGTSDPRLYRPL